MLGALLLLLMAVAGGGTPGAAAQSPAGIDVLLLVDASSGMEVSDAKDLGVDAGQLFIDLMAPAVAWRWLNSLAVRACSPGLIRGGLLLGRARISAQQSSARAGPERGTPRTSCRGFSPP
ncbi:MAG: hypothetical protein IPG47_02555 [Thermoflexaceae bacterium]|nr:hypothetical protein [Thermoflexaceae bacterium]